MGIDGNITGFDVATVDGEECTTFNLRRARFHTFGICRIYDRTGMCAEVPHAAYQSRLQSLTA